MLGNQDHEQCLPSGNFRCCCCFTLHFQHFEVNFFTYFELIFPFRFISELFRNVLSQIKKLEENNHRFARAVSSRSGGKVENSSNRLTVRIDTKNEYTILQIRLFQIISLYSPEIRVLIFILV